MADWSFLKLLVEMNIEDKLRNQVSLLINGNISTIIVEEVQEHDGKPLDSLSLDFPSENHQNQPETGDSLLLPR